MKKFFTNLAFLMANLTKGYYNEISLLKIFAFFLITWFHMKFVAPDGYKNIFVGGGGNGIFMFCSGYLFHMKPEKFKGQWIFQKWFRMLSSVWFFLIFAVILTYPVINFKWFNFFYPSGFWFVDALLLYFVVSYIARKIIKNEKEEIRNLFILGSVLLSYFYIKENQINKAVIMDYGGWVSWCMYFLVFLSGRWCKLENIKTKSFFPLFWFVPFALYFGYKFFALDSQNLLLLQVVVIPLLMEMTVVLLFGFCTLIIDMPFVKRISVVIVFLSNLTLELYIVQVFLIHYFGNYFPFPFNILILFVLIVSVAAIIHICVDIMKNGLTCLSCCFNKRFVE